MGRQSARGPPSPAHRANPSSAAAQLLQLLPAISSLRFLIFYQIVMTLVIIN